MPGFIKRSKEVMRRKREEEPTVFVLYFVLRVLVLVTLVRSAFLGHYEHMMLCVLTLVLLLIPSFIEHTLDIDLPDLLESIILLFIFAAEIYSVRSMRSTSASPSGIPFSTLRGVFSARGSDSPSLIFSIAASRPRFT